MPTPEERAAGIWPKIDMCAPGEEEGILAAAVREAVLEERQACARVVEKTSALIMPTAEVAARIRDRP